MRNRSYQKKSPLSLRSVQKCYAVLRYGVMLVILVIVTLYVLDYLFLHRGSMIIAPDAKKANKISFYAIGDQGTGGFWQYLVSAKMELDCQSSRDVNFTLLLGDNFYFDGVDNVNDPQFNEAFEEPYSSRCLSGMPFYAILGNHDYRGNPYAQIEYSKLAKGSGRWKMPNNTYVKDFGDKSGTPIIRLVVIDTQKPMEGQIELLKESFYGNNRAMWNIVAGHKPIKSYGLKYHTKYYTVQDILPVLKELKVDIYIAGHSHNLQLIEEKERPIFIISGGGGKPTRALIDGNKPGLLYGEDKNGFVKITATEETLVIIFNTILKDKAFEYLYRQKNKS